MKKIIRITVIIYFTQLINLFGQDIHFTQFYASPLYLNPAFTGANVCSRVSMVYRNQWPEIKKTYQSYLLSYDHYIPRKHIGMGLLCAVDDAGTGGLRTTVINPSFAYELTITRKIAFRAGIQPGVVIKSIHFNRLLFGDQIERKDNSGNLAITSVELPINNQAFADVSAGALIYSAKHWLGISFAHLNKPLETFYKDDEARLPIKYSVHGGTKIILNQDEKDADLYKSISVVGHYRGQAEFDQFDLGVYYSQYGFNLGMWYRGIPGLKAYKPGYKNDDALAFIIGFQKNSLHIGYSYDLTISKLHRLTQGAHELTLSFQMCKLKHKIKRMLVACPTF